MGRKVWVIMKIKILSREEVRSMSGAAARTGKER